MLSSEGTFDYSGALKMMVKAVSGNQSKAISCSKKQSIEVDSDSDDNGYADKGSSGDDEIGGDAGRGDDYDKASSEDDEDEDDDEIGIKQEQEQDADEVGITVGGRVSLHPNKTHGACTI
jgi:hypothetical protein